jgi:hypothetical protein
MGSSPLASFGTTNIVHSNKSADLGLILHTFICACSSIANVIVGTIGSSRPAVVNALCVASASIKVINFVTSCHLYTAGDFSGVAAAVFSGGNFDFFDVCT